MRNFIIFLLFTVTLNAFEKGKLEIVWYKVTNGSYEISLPWRLVIGGKIKNRKEMVKWELQRLNF